MKTKSGFRPFRIQGGDKKIKHYIEDLRAQIVQAVQPQQIILFGSYAYGQPHEDSDVDLLVVMPFEGSPYQQAFKIRMGINAPFALDLLVRTPEYVAQQLEWGDCFMQEVISQGKVIYEATHTAMGQKSRRRLAQRAA